MNRYFGLHTLEGEWHSLLPRYLLLADRVQGRRILDIGCGTGIGSSLLLEMGAEHVDAIDHRPAVLELARMKHAKPGLDFHVMFWEELGFPDESFDLVLCLEPSSPVTDPSLLREMRRVLTPGGEYVCAIERKKLAGLESLLPRYGYTNPGASVDVHNSRDSVPQLGELTSLFETVVSVVQRPQYSYVFDLMTVRDSPLSEAALAEGSDSDRQPGEEGAAAEMRKVSVSGEGEGLWSGETSSATDDQRGPSAGSSGRWISVDHQLCTHDRDVSGVELLFCGDSHLPPAPVREVRMPYFSLVERLQIMLTDLQVRQSPDHHASGFGDVVDAPAGFSNYSDHDATSEYQAINEWDALPTQVRPPLSQTAAYSPQGASNPHQMEQMQAQLNEISTLYHQVRHQMEHLVHDTRRELTERDHYIETLVGTLQQWENHYQNNGAPEATAEPEQERETTNVFAKVEVEGSPLVSLGARNRGAEPPPVVADAPDESEESEEASPAQDVASPAQDAVGEPSEAEAEPPEEKKEPAHESE